jgi:hypothetical protein
MKINVDKIAFKIVCENQRNLWQNSFTKSQKLQKITINLRSNKSFFNPKDT